jgi:hypothetical protein
VKIAKSTIIWIASLVLLATTIQALSVIIDPQWFRVLFETIGLVTFGALWGKLTQHLENTYDN